jgi:hypothetical protein
MADKTHIILPGGGGGMRGMHVNMNAMNGEHYDNDEDIDDHNDGGYNDDV